MKKKVKSNIINWFPGHMTKAKREMEVSLKLVDMVIELRDSRVPKSSSNPLLDKLINNKPRLIILTKIDKADDKETRKWVDFYSENDHCIALNILKDDVLAKIKSKCLMIREPWINKQKAKGINPRSIRVMVIGIPNVGKSTLINRFVKKKIMKAYDKPGVTRVVQWVKIDKSIDLLDTPGILWPRFESEEIGLNLALIGSINDNILDKKEVVKYGFDILSKYYPDKLKELCEISDFDTMIKEIGKKRNFYKKEAEIDVDRTINVLLNELRNDKFLGITWERYEM